MVDIKDIERLVAEFTVNGEMKIADWAEKESVTDTALVEVGVRMLRMHGFLSPMETIGGYMGAFILGWEAHKQYGGSTISPSAL